MIKKFKKFLDLRKVYVIVFASLAGWALFAYFTMTNMIEYQNIYAKIINLSGKQRMLSQKTTLIAKRYFETNDSYLKTHLKELIDLMGNDHKYIISNLRSKDTNNIYFQEPINLNKQVTQYINLLTHFYTSKDNETLKKIENISFELLPRLNDAVNLFEQESNKKTQELIQREKFILFGTLFTLLLEAIFIVMPSLNQTKRKEKEIRELNRTLERRIKKAIRENRKKDKMLQQQFHLASMAEMLNNISHQWRQPLSLISTMASALKVEKELGSINDDSFNEKTETIINRTKYLSKIIDDFKDFIEPNDSSEHLNINKSIEKTISIIDSTLKDKNIKLIKELEENSSYLKGENSKFSTALMNILTNSIDFLESNKIESPYIKISSKKINDKIRITISDNALGIDEKILPKIFNIYFTTKHQSQGTGLGLYITYEIIKRQFEGDILAQNTKDGVSFIIELPI